MLFVWWTNVIYLVGVDSKTHDDMILILSSKTHQTYIYPSSKAQIVLSIDFISIYYLICNPPLSCTSCLPSLSIIYTTSQNFPQWTELTQTFPPSLLTLLSAKIWHLYCLMNSRCRINGIIFHSTSLHIKIILLNVRYILWAVQNGPQKSDGVGLCQPASNQSLLYINQNTRHILFGEHTGS